LKTKAYEAKSATDALTPTEIDRREPAEHDVEVEILYSGVCHSDIHTAHNDWHGTKYPVVPGHEIIGRVTRVGDQVTKHKVGDTVGVGVMVNSCRTCSACKQGLEQYCENGMVGTYNGQDPIDGTITKGGYSQSVVVTEDFVYVIPEGLDIEKAAPLLCAGITTYSPLKHWGAGPGKKVGVVGLGGLGHMAVKFAAALGADVYLITTSPDKASAAQEYGAKGAVVSKDEAAMAEHQETFDLLIDTVPVGHNAQPYIDLLARDGALVLVGPVEPMPGFDGDSLIHKRRAVAGSMIGGRPETQEMLEFCAEHGILPDVEMIKMEDINDAYEHMMKKGMSKRYVIDMKKSFDD
jgi:uncharacterized zinc-type alcohol dehydrogenase-like protein